MTQSTKHRRATLLTVATLGLVIASPSHAYLDPGTGSIILQGLLAGIAVGIGLVRHYWQQCKLFFARLTGRSRDDHSDGETEFEQTSNAETKS